MEQLQTWYRTSLGQRIGAAERRAVAEALRSFRIGDAVWVGGCPGRLCLTPTLRQWQAGRGGDLVAEPTQLPFRAGSLEALVLGHVLDVGYDPQAVLQEALQVLRPEGRLVVLTFNPFGLWGAVRLWGRLRGSGAPWRGPQWPAAVVAQRLRRVGFEGVEARYLGFRPPAADPRLQERFDGWERWGRWGGRWGAAVHLVTGVRRDIASLGPPLATPLRMPGRLVGGAAQPACLRVRRRVALAVGRDLNPKGLNRKREDED